MAFVGVSAVARVNGAASVRDAVSARASQRAVVAVRRRAPVVLMTAEEGASAADSSQAEQAPEVPEKAAPEAVVAPEEAPVASPEAVTDDAPEPVADAAPEVLAGASSDSSESAADTDKKMSFEEIVADQEYDGVIKTTTTYGAFVDIGAPTDGLLHVSQMADRFVQNVTDIVNPGDKVTVRVMTVNPQKKEFSLSMKNKGSSSQASETREGRVPWSAWKFDEQKFVEGTVISTAAYGAFINVGGPTDGMCHISEMSDDRTDNVADVMKAGDKVQVRITSADTKRNRISLSLKQWAPNARDTLKAELEAAEEHQPEFKTSMELAFEKAKANTKA